MKRDLRFVYEKSKDYDDKDRGKTMIRVAQWAFSTLPYDIEYAQYQLMMHLRVLYPFHPNFRLLPSNHGDERHQ